MSPTHDEANHTSTQLAIVGAGPGGYAAAFVAADLGMQVTLIDPEPNPGGVCLYRGCIPSKALLHVAKVIGEARAASQWGIRFSEPEVDLAQLRTWKDGVVGKLVGGLGQLTKRRNIQYLRGHARFTGAKNLAVELVGGDVVELHFEHAIVATGSRPTTLPGLPESARVLDSSSALAIDKIPASLLVVGGGYIGLELGSVYAALGSRVTVVELASSLLPGVDADLVRPLAKRLNGLFDDILVNTRVDRMEERADGLHVTLEGDGLQQPVRVFDSALVSVGRKPNSHGFGLETTGIQIDDDGFVEVDAQLSTSVPSIRAIGDVTGQPMLAHKASHQGRIAVEAISGKKVAFEPRAIPAVVFTDPEIAWCGLTESEAKQAGHKVAITRFPWAASGRAMTMDRTDGMTKLIIDPETERVLGVGVVGSGAGELISEGVLAVELAALAADIKLSIHPHPTLSETIMEAAEIFFGQSTHLYRPRKP